MTILVFGYSGQVATQLRHQGTVVALGSDICDLSQPDAVKAAMQQHRPSVVINAAAYTNVDKAEEQEDLATQINAVAVGQMAQLCASQGIPLVHISTDYVFPGDGDRPWDVDADTGPLGAYGRSKLKGEDAIRAAGGVYAILRTSWVVSAHGHNFVKTMLRLGADRDLLTIVGDQIGGPTGGA